MTNITNNTTPASNDNAAARLPEVLNRDSSGVRVKLFDQYALKDQKAYYLNTYQRSDKSARQVNVIRASFSLLTGVASIATGLLFALSSGDLSSPVLGTPIPVSGLIGLLLVLSIIAPALGGAFGTLADLYQWDRLASIYRAALASIEVADSLSPNERNEDQVYIRKGKAFIAGTLAVMRDETGQWGSLIRTPEQLDQFVSREQAYADELSKSPDQRKDGPIMTGFESGRNRPPVPTAPPVQPVQPASVFAPKPNQPTPPATPPVTPTTPITPPVNNPGTAAIGTQSVPLAPADGTGSISNPELPPELPSQLPPQLPPDDDPTLSTPGVG